MSVVRKSLSVVFGLLALLSCQWATAIQISEIRIDQPSSDNDEFFELSGVAGESLNDLTYLVLGDGAGGSGVIEAVISLEGQSLSTAGFFVAAESTFTLGTADLTTSINFENSDNVTHLLVRGFSGANGDDLDTDDDGNLDTIPWTDVEDAVALVESIGNGDRVYATQLGGASVGPDGSFVPGYVCLADGVFVIGAFDPSAPDAIDSPGSAGCDGGNGGGTGDPIAVKIHEIQGSGATVLITEPVVVEGVVTTLFEDNDLVEGFFLQEEDSEVDADPATSEGIFVFCDDQCPPTLGAGQLVSVTGTPADFFGMSQINANNADDNVTIVSETASSVTPTVFALPASSSTTAEATFEALEGMLVTYPETLVISEYFQLGRFGQLVLAPAARPQQFTSSNLPSVEGFAAFQDSLAANRIILDDLDNDQNEVLGTEDEPYFYPQGGLSIDNYFRGGDSIEALTGVMHWSFAGSGGTNAWRIRPIPGEDYTFSSDNPRPAKPNLVAGSLKVASFNVLNYFTTIDIPGNLCGPSNLGCRGADSGIELKRQQSKIIAALSQMDADVIALIEIENDATTALNSLATALSEATGKAFNYINTGSIGTDAIKVGMLYNEDRVAPAGLFAILDSTVDPRFVDTRNRPMLAQTFSELASGAKFTAVAGHLKSKGSACDDLDDPDLGDGQGNCNQTRTAATEALVDWLATDPTNSGDADVLVIGDLNAYAMEDPITAMEAAGYSNLIKQFVSADAYSFVFDGQLGYLDHALASPSLKSQIAGATIWHINADEVNLLDYNDAVQDESEASFERESGALELFAANAARASDHDPVIVGLALRNPADVNGDSCVDRTDRFVVFLGALVQRWFDRYTPELDLNNDGVVNVADVKIVRQNYSLRGGRSCSKH